MYSYVCYCARTRQSIEKGKKVRFLNPSRSEKIEKKCCGLCCRAACITRNFFKTQNLQLINKSGFKSRAAYNGVRMVLVIILNFDQNKASLFFFRD